MTAITATARTITRTADAVRVSYPLAWSKAIAWRHLLSNPPEGVRQPRAQSHRQLWAKAHTADAWVWKATPVA